MAYKQTPFALLLLAPLGLAVPLMGCGDDTSNPLESGTTGEETTGETTRTTVPTTDPTTTPGTSSEGSSSTSTDAESSSSTSEGDTDEGSSGDTGLPHECELDEPGICIDEMNAQVCQEVDGLRQWVDVACGEDATCIAGGCASPIQQEFITQLTTYLDGVQAGTAVAADVDWDDLREQAASLVVAGDDSADTLYRAGRALQLQIPQGHQWVRFGPGQCGVPEGMPYTQQTFYGACGRISGDGVIVTVADDANPLGLLPGDRIVGSDRWEEGEDFLDQVAHEPLCSTLTPSNPNALRRQAAGDLLGLLDEGDTITVIDPAGDSREVAVPARLAEDPVGWCLNPIEGGFSNFEAALTIRPDGVAVIRVPHFGPNETPFPNPLTAESYYQWVSDYVDRLAGVMSTIPADAPIIWDARGNSGGAAEVPMAIVAGMPGANRTQISQGFQRILNTDPFEFTADPLPTFSFEVPEDYRLNHAAPTAVLVDYSTTSAADFFVWGAKEFSDAIVVGTPGTANYGFGGLGAVVVGIGRRARLPQRPAAVAHDGRHPARGRGGHPGHRRRVRPVRLAGGVDTVLEAAVEALLE